MNDRRALLLALCFGTSLPAISAADDKPAKSDKDAPAASCAHTATVYGAKARCWRTQKTLERADKLGVKVDYHDVDADPAAMKYAMSNKDHLKHNSKGEIMLPLLLIDGKIVEPELATLDAACGVKK